MFIWIKAILMSNELFNIWNVKITQYSSYPNCHLMKLGQFSVHEDCFSPTFL